MIMWACPIGRPRSFAVMEGFGVPHFRVINAAGNRLRQVPRKPKLKLQSVVWSEAVTITGRTGFPSPRTPGMRFRWATPGVGARHAAVRDEAFAESFAFDVLDATKLIPEEDVPIRLVGRLVLDRLVENFFAETEQAAFCTQNIVRGIDFSNDPLLQGRNFSYLDTQLKRLGGPNFTQIPINAPKCPVAHFQQDGHIAMRNPQGMSTTILTAGARGRSAGIGGA